MLTSGCQIGVSTEIATLLNYLSTDETITTIITNNVLRAGKNTMYNKNTKPLFRAIRDISNTLEVLWQIDVFMPQKYKPIGSNITSIKPWDQFHSGNIWFRHVSEHTALPKNSDLYELLVSYLPDYMPIYYVAENLPILSLNVPLTTAHTPRFECVTRHFFRSTT